MRLPGDGCAFERGLTSALTSRVARIYYKTDPAED